MRAERKGDPHALYLAMFDNNTHNRAESSRSSETARPQRRSVRNKQKGFSLIELLIVVAIILIIAAIAIPNLLRSKMAANEASAVGSMRTINTACVVYSTTYGGYPSALSNLGPATTATSGTADLVDSVLATGTKSGYEFTYAATSTDASGNVLAYTLTGNPVTRGTTGQRGFFTDQTGVIRANTTTTATAASTPLS
jgi:prepilin-type N-terminal cleavage/methylation domain-containing protein